MLIRADQRAPKSKSSYRAVLDLTLNFEDLLAFLGYSLFLIDHFVNFFQ